MSVSELAGIGTRPAPPAHVDFDPSPFWRRVTPGGSDECWPWEGAMKPNGYGHLWIGGQRPQYAHRVSWMIHRGPIPAGLLVLHTCDVRRCVNPKHLWLGTQRDNVHDALRKGRLPTGDESFPRRHPERLARGTRHRMYGHPELVPTVLHPECRARGERVATARLTEQDVREIRARAQRGEGPRALARAFGVHHKTVQQVVRRVTWTHIAEDQHGG
jgi:hypothetical protein